MKKVIRCQILVVPDLGYVLRAMHKFRAKKTKGSLTKSHEVIVNKRTALRFIKGFGILT